MKNFIVHFGGEPQQISIAAETHEQALSLALASFRNSVGEITVVEDPNFELLQENLAIAARARNRGIRAGKSLTPAKLASNKRNAQKAGRRFDYIVVGNRAGKREVLGLATTNRKEKLLQDCREMFVDCENIQLILATKASKEDMDAAKVGIRITPECVIV